MDRRQSENQSHRHNQSWRRQRSLLTWLLALCVGGGLIFLTTQQGAGSPELAIAALKKAENTEAAITDDLPLGQLRAKLPAAKVHPLPPTLANWQDPANSGDYFNQVQPTSFGYLVWSHFPVQVYIELPITDRRDQAPQGNASDPSRRAQDWSEAVLQAVDEWSAYLPLAVTDQPAQADIQIWRAVPPIQRRPDGQLARIRSAETSYAFYLQEDAQGQTVLAPRYRIFLSPNQTATYTVASARHELGHALGIWGHSSSKSDALYFSQVRRSPPISRRDVNTLKRLYQQPTRLGWPLKAESSFIR